MGGRGLFIAALLPLLTACGPSYMETGRAYMAQGSPALALEYLDAGQQKRAGAANRRELLRIHQLYVRDLQREIDFLKRQKQAMRALSRVTVLEEVTLRGEVLKVPGASMAQLNKDLKDLHEVAIEQLDEELSERVSRGQYLRSDLAVCRQLLALQSDRGSSVARRCESLREHFKHYASIEVTPESQPADPNWLTAVMAAFNKRHPELFGLVNGDDGRRNARLRITLGRFAHEDTGWHLADRIAYRKAVAIRDRKNRLVKETVKVPPTQAEIDRAKKSGKPVPQERLVVKQLYRHTAGELFVFNRVIWAAAPVTVSLQRDTADGAITTVEFTERVATRAEARYETFEGDAEANPRPKSTRPDARAQAERQLPGPGQMAGQLMGQLADQIAKRLLERVE